MKKRTVWLIAVGSVAVLAVAILTTYTLTKAAAGQNQAAGTARQAAAPTVTVSSLAGAGGDAMSATSVPFAGTMMAAGVGSAQMGSGMTGNMGGGMMGGMGSGPMGNTTNGMMGGRGSGSAVSGTMSMQSGCPMMSGTSGGMMGNMGSGSPLRNSAAVTGTVPMAAAGCPAGLMGAGAAITGTVMSGALGCPAQPAAGVALPGSPLQPLIPTIAPEAMGTATPMPGMTMPQAATRTP